MLQNIVGQYWEKLTTGWKLGGGTTKRYLTVNGASDTEITGGATAYTRAYLNKNYLVGEQRTMGNGGFYDNGCIHGKLGLNVTHYTGNASVDTIVPYGFFPHFSAHKSQTAVQGVLWNYKGLCKGSAVAATVGNVNGIASTGLGVNLGATAQANTNAAQYSSWGMCAHDGSLTGVRAACGTYVGNATNPKAITVTGFGSPDLVIVKAETAVSSVFRTSDQTCYPSAGTVCDYFLISTASLATQGIISLDANGFSVGTATAVNSNLVNYDWMMFKSVAGGNADFCVTEFIGKVGDMHVELPFQPNILFFIPAGANACKMWTSSQATANMTNFISSATAGLLLGVQKVDPYGFYLQSDADLNLIGNPVQVIAIKTDF